MIYDKSGNAMTALPSDFTHEPCPACGVSITELEMQGKEYTITLDLSTMVTRGRTVYASDHECDPARIKQYKHRNMIVE